MPITFQKIDPGELNHALLSAHDEIIGLRRRLAEAEPKARAYDTIERMMGLTVREQGAGFAPDPAWQIKTLLEQAHKDGATDAQDTQ